MKSAFILFATLGAMVRQACSHHLNERPTSRGPVTTSNAQFSQADYAAEVKRLTPLAARGDADAEFRLGRMYDFAQGVPRYVDKMVALYAASAAQGNSDGENGLGACYEGW